MIANNESIIARIREVYPIDRRPCAWCNSRKSHHFDCPVPDIHALLEMVGSHGNQPLSEASGSAQSAAPKGRPSQETR